MTKRIAARLLSIVILALAVACGAQVKPTPNDEVTSPLGPLDQAALEDQSSGAQSSGEEADGAAGESSDDASESEAPDTASPTP